jgi:hypothetical protein
MGIGSDRKKCCRRLTDSGKRRGARCYEHQNAPNHNVANLKEYYIMAIKNYISTQPINDIRNELEKIAGQSIAIKNLTGLGFDHSGDVHTQDSILTAIESIALQISSGIDNLIKNEGSNQNTKFEESREGAKACLTALLSMKSKAEKGNNGWAEWWKNEDDAIAAMLHAAGNPNGYQAGFIAVLSEYIHAQLLGCDLNLDTWRNPEATMTENEKIDYRIKFEKSGDE